MSRYAPSSTVYPMEMFISDSSLPDLVSFYYVASVTVAVTLHNNPENMFANHAALH